MSLTLDKSQILPEKFPPANTSNSGIEAGYGMHEKIWGRVLQTLELPDGLVDTNGVRGIGKNGQVSNAITTKGVSVINRSEDPLLQFCLNTLIPYIKGLPSKKTQVEKISAFINFVGSNPGFQDRTVDNEPMLLGEIFQRKGAVCRHKSLIFKITCDELGIESGIRGGFVLQDGEYTRHLWNEVCIDGTWFVVDNAFQKDTGIFTYQDTPNTYYLREENSFLSLENIGEGKKEDF